MPKNYSIFLDGVRLFAALMVLLGHFSFPLFSGGALPRIPIEHDGVVIFFLLSGYVIGYCAHERETTLAKFGVARAARVLSVAIPALILTIVLDRAGMALAPKLYGDAYEFRKWYLYVPLFMSFTSEIWLLKISAFSNTPYWSLVYEVWYYAFFASLFFFRGPWRVAAAGAAFLVMGPKIWILAPLWFAGYALYRIHKGIGISPATAALLAALALIAYGAIKFYGVDSALDGWANAMSGDWIRQHLSGSQFFLGDYLKGLCIFLALFSARYCLPRWVEDARVARPVRYASQFTFSLYLFHFPILMFLAAALPGSTGAIFRIAMVFLVVLTLGGWCEAQKGRLRRLFTGMIAPFTSTRLAVSAPPPP